MALAAETTATGPTIERVEPNPVTEGNVGEYVVIDIPTETNLSGWTLSDGTYTAELPNRTIEGRFALTEAPRVTALLTDTPIVPWEGNLPLSAEGDTISLARPDGEIVDEISYDRTTDGEGWTRTTSGTLRPSHGGEPIAPFSPRSVDAATAFVLPDAPTPVVEAFRTAQDRLWVGGYEFTDPVIRDLLIDRHAAGVDVRLLLDGNPVGGQSPQERETLDRLMEAGIPVQVLDGERRRYQFYHPKYAVADDTAIVLSENWKPTGTGGGSSRGWGIAMRDTEIAEDLAHVFESDSGWRDGRSWSRMASPGGRATPNDSEPLPIDNHEPRSIDVERAEIVVAPYAAEERLRSLIEGAEESLDIQQVSIGDPAFSLLDAAIEAADRGVDVRIHLDHTWYVSDENEALARRLASLADDDDLPLDIAVSDPNNRYEKIHNKGMIVDEETVVVGSMNWNNASMRANREVVTIVHGAEAADYYTTVFEADWNPPDGQLPIGYTLVVVGLWVGAGTIAYRRVQFVPDYAS